MLWDVVDIVESVIGGLQRRAEADDLEQAVRSIDALDELALHPLIHQALRQAGYGVWCEEHYPSDRTPRRSKSEGKRCDLVLTPDERPLAGSDADLTLFAPPDPVALEAAYWLEIKTVAQFTPEGPFPYYSKELLSSVSQDIKKLATDPALHHAGLLLVLFTAAAAVAEHDLSAWHDRCLRRHDAVAPPVQRCSPPTDRHGNAHLTCALFPVRRL